MTISPAARPSDALLLMDDHDVRHLPVVERDLLVGVISDRDLFDVVGWMPGFPPPRTQPGHSVVVRDVMRRGLTTVSPRDTVVTAGVHMSMRRIGCLPVVEGGRLVGIVTETDLLRAYARGCREGEIDGASDETVEQLMSRRLFTIGSDATLEQAMARSHALRVRHLPVVDSERLVGIVSDRDLRAAVGSGQPGRTPVASFMSMDVISIAPQARVSMAAERMLHHKFSCLPVVDRNARLKGLVTATDLLDHCTQTLREPERHRTG